MVVLLGRCVVLNMELAPGRQAVSSVGYVLRKQKGIFCKFYLQCYSDEYDGF